jgi:adenylate cyclase
MSLEIERKFLLLNDSWRQASKALPYTQGYLSRGGARTVRIRTAGDKAFLTIKGPVVGISRAEFEYAIPPEDARQMLQLCEPPLIEKTRHTIFASGHLWEIDEFHGANEGLLVAEVELDQADEEISLPCWIGKEVTGDPRYYNSNLGTHPYSAWVKDQ